MCPFPRRSIAQDDPPSWSIEASSSFHYLDEYAFLYKVLESVSGCASRYTRQFYI